MKYIQFSIEKWNAYKDFGGKLVYRGDPNNVHPEAVLLSTAAKGSQPIVTQGKDLTAYTIRTHSVDGSYYESKIGISYHDLFIQIPVTKRPITFAEFPAGAVIKDASNTIRVYQAGIDGILFISSGTFLTWADLIEKKYTYTTDIGKPLSQCTWHKFEVED